MIGNTVLSVEYVAFLIDYSFLLSNVGLFRLYLRDILMDDTRCSQAIGLKSNRRGVFLISNRRFFGLNMGPF